MTYLRRHWFCTAALQALLVACSGEGSPAEGIAGGTKASAGASAAGGSSSARTEGVMGAAGRSGTGSAVEGRATGGDQKAGGNLSSGGVPAVGSGATGRSSIPGGTIATIGTPSAGGSSAAGDPMASGGAPDAGVRDAYIVDAAGRTSVDVVRDSQGVDTTRDSPGPDATVNTSTAVTVYVAGDSTVSTYSNSSIKQAGWGQFLQTYFITNAKVVNKAVGGMTARHFIEAGYLDQILAVIKAGDYLLVQFGTNDSNKTATYTLNGQKIPYYLAPDTDYKTYLTKYVTATRAKGATTIFVTPPPRHSCSGTSLGVANGLATYATAMKELAPTVETEVVDLNAMTLAYLSTIACDVSGKTFYLVKADGTIDSTHFQENGANVMAGLVAKGTSGIRTLALPLSFYLK